MKKQNYLLASLAILALMTSCNKDQELVTLGAVINQPSKTYINDRYPCWNNGDQVYVNHAAYPISAASGPSAQIANVVSADGYRAIFPASLVTPGSNIAMDATIPVSLPATQKYQVVDGHQRVDAPMGAYTDGSTLLFHNLCSILHVVVNNNMGSDMTLRSLKMETANAMLSGTGTATVNGASDDGITLSSDASHAVSLRLSGATNVTLAAGAQSAFDIYVPAFPTDNVTITLTTTNGYYYELAKNSVALAPNTYTTVTLNVDQLTQILAAELVDGPTFNAAIPDNATAVVFEYNSPVSSGTLLSTLNSPVPIYGNLDGTTWRVSTSASMINANPNCSEMFKSKSIRNGWTSESPLMLIDFGTNFNTSNVTDMSYMFSWCSNITNLDISLFHTENVTDMAWMFERCFNLTNLDVSIFNTSRVTSMHCMFIDCQALQSLDVSNFNTSYVTDMAFMFEGCSGLTSLDVSHFNTANVIDMSGMFESCMALTTIDLSNFNTSNVTDMSFMFMDCYELDSLDFSSFNTEHVGKMNQMFYGCRSLTNLDLSYFNTSNVTLMQGMFNGCYNLENLDVSHFNTLNVTQMASMFYNCENLTSLDLSSFNTPNVSNMVSLFSCCYNLTNLDISRFNMDRVSNKSSMCAGLSTTSGACTITCPVAVRTALESGTGLPTSGVTFTWVTPTSK